MPISPQADMTDAEIIASVEGDADACPTPAGMKRQWTIDVRALRMRLSVTQAEFAARYHIPLPTVRDWEQRRCLPDQAALAYLRAISLEPQVIAEILARRPERRDAAE